MYVDDTDLLHTVDAPENTDEEFIEQVQQATMSWRMLVHVTGKIIKPQKCGVYFQTYNYKFVRGQPKLKNPKDLPPPIWYVTREDESVAPAHITVPQPDGSTALIPTMEVMEFSKGLGVLFNVAGDGTDHLINMKKKGLTWRGKLLICPFSTGEPG